MTQLVAQGLATNAIAGRLHLSPWTVQDHLKAIFEKVGVSTRGELVARMFFEHYAPRLRHAPGLSAGAQKRIRQVTLRDNTQSSWARRYSRAVEPWPRHRNVRLLTYSHAQGPLTCDQGLHRGGGAAGGRHVQHWSRGARAERVSV